MEAGPKKRSSNVSTYVSSRATSFVLLGGGGRLDRGVQLTVSMTIQGSFHPGVEADEDAYQTMVENVCQGG